MKNRKYSVLVIVILSGAVVLYGACAEVAAQSAQRGFSSRGINRVGAQRSAVTPRVSRPNSSQSVLRNRAMTNPGGPLSVDLAPLMSGPAVIFDSSMFNAAGDASALTDIGLQTGTPSAGFRPSVRPRLDIADRNAMASKGVLGKIRDTVLQQIAQCAEKPFSPEWYAAHGSVTPIPTTGDNPWMGGSWPDAKAWVGMDAEPQRYDFRPDSRGLIFIYQGEVQRGRAVDGRAAAVELAHAALPAADASPGLSLGVFAAVPPVDKPVESLVHLVVGKSGTVVGYQYDFATDSMQPLRGAVDHASQRLAWQVGSVVTEAGVANLTDDVSRALVFRDDGWTQAWILLRIPELVAAEPLPAQQ
jgi:hypothetical protein